MIKMIKKLLNFLMIAVFISIGSFFCYNLFVTFVVSNPSYISSAISALKSLQLSALFIRIVLYIVFFISLNPLVSKFSNKTLTNEQVDILNKAKYLLVSSLVVFECIFWLGRGI